MYIPKPALEDCLTSEISASGGDVMYDYITGSQIRRVHYFGWNTGSYEFEVHQGCTDSTQLFLVGAGGSGGFIPSQSVSQNPPNYPAGGMLGGAGGGGAGGVLFINPNRELTGSLAIVPGKYPITIGEGGFQNGFIDSTDFNNQGTFNSGEDTTFKYPFRLANDADIPSGSVSSSKYDYDSVYIKAGGGGFGSYSKWVIVPTTGCGQSGTHYEPRSYKAADGGSGGGGGYAADGSICSPWTGNSGSVIYPFRNQGNDGGASSVTLQRGGGGGGAFGPGGVGNGGGWVEESIRGYQDYFGQGGTGQFTFENLGTLLIQNNFVSGSQRNFVKGVGGYGLTANIPLSNYDLSSPPGYNQGGWIDDLSYTNGTDGEAIITYALTGSQLTQGRLHYIEGGASGGDFTFIPCGEVRLETLTVPAGKSACICAMDTGLTTYISGRSGNNGELWWSTVDLPVSSSDQYKFSPEKQMASLPSGSGTVTFTTGSTCQAYVPFEGWDTCGPCQESAPAGIYIGFDISGSSGRTAPLPYYKYPDTTVHYTSSQNYITESRYNNHDSESYFQTRVGAISNDFDDDIPYSNFVPSASFSTSYDDQNVTFITGSECYTYYDCDFLDQGPLTASGGETGSFISGSGVGNEYIYKYHIFQTSGSTNELTQRSFQDFTINGGSSDDINILIIGPGGPGGKGSGSNAGHDFFGGGGGAGQVKVDKPLGLCNAYSLKIAPGFAMPWGTSTDVDTWQQGLGQTIISASEGIYYESAGLGGRGSSPGNNSANNTWTERSGSGGGGAAINATYVDLLDGATSSLQTDGGDGYPGTGSAGGGGGSAENGFTGSAGTSAKGGEGGDGLRLNLDGTLKYYAGGGAGFGPGGPSDGGFGGGGDSGIGLSTGSFYGAGGGAWVGATQTYTTPWGGTYFLNGKGADGAVIINYKYELNHTVSGSIADRGLSQYYDIYDTNSYDGTGSLVYSLWTNNTTASLGNDTGWEYNTSVLGGKGQLEIVNSAVHPYVETENETGNGEYSFLVTWFSNSPTYDTASNSYPILTMENYGTSSFGMYAGNNTTYNEAVVIRIGDTEVVTEPDTAGEFVPRGGYHISQFSYKQSSNELLWYMDGYSGSATVSEDVSTKDILMSFNSASAAIGLGSDSVYNNTAIYTASLTWDEMRHNDDFLFPRY